MLWLLRKPAPKETVNKREAHSAPPIPTRDRYTYKIHAINNKIIPLKLVAIHALSAAVEKVGGMRHRAIRHNDGPLDG